MSMTLEFCEARALEAAQAAHAAPLSNVRERELRSEAAWRAMADRIQATLTARDVRARAALEGGAAETEALAPTLS